MRYTLVTAIFLCVACKNNIETVSPTMVVQKGDLKSKNTIWTDPLNKNKYELPDSIGGKPASWYINNPNVAPIAKMLYLNKFRPIDNDSTTILLSFVTTKDSSIRPFYRWCLDFAITISDGALGEYLGKPAFEYATLYPNEFFNYMDKDSSGSRYKLWVEIIAYSGLSDYTKPHNKLKQEIILNMSSNCRNCTTNLKEHILKFATDIMETVKFID